MTLQQNQTVEDVIARADDVLRIPFAMSAEEKESAILALSEVNDTRALKVMVDALNLIEFPITGSRLARGRQAHGGTVSLAAARALVCCKTESTRKILWAALTNSQAHPLLKASIILGCSRNPSPKYLDMIWYGLLEDSDWTVRVAAMQSMKQLVKGDVLSDDQRVQLLEELVILFITEFPDDDSVREDFLSLALYMIEALGSEETLEWFEDEFTSRRGVYFGHRLAMLLSAFPGEKATDLMIDLLEKVDQLPETYQFLAEELARRELQIPQLARLKKIMDETDFILTLKSFFLAATDTLRVRKAAAKKALLIKDL